MRFSPRWAPTITYAAIAVAVVVVVAIVAWRTGDKLPDPPDGVSCFTITVRVPVEPSSIDDDWWRKQGYQAKQLVRLDSGEVIAPILQIIRPNHGGFMGGVQHNPVWEETYHYLGGRQAWLYLPIDDKIEQHIVLVRRLLSNGEPGEHLWRVWVFGPADIDKGLVMPPFDELQLLNRRTEADDWLRKDRAAGTFAMELRE